MKTFLTISLAFASLILLPSGNLFAQAIQEVPISAEGTVISTNCSEPIIITDSNASGGDYAPGESYQITACINTIEAPPVMVTILPTNPITGAVWDVDANSSLFIYEGTGTTGNLLGEFNSVSDPDGVFFTTSATCVTFVFISGAESSGAGFAANVNCIKDLQPFDLAVTVLDPHEFSTEEFVGLEGKNVITICYADNISLEAVVNFPLSDATGNGYEQDIATTKFTWDWGDGLADEGMSLINNEHVYLPYGGFLARVTAVDAMGNTETFEFFVLAAPRPIFSGILFDNVLCAGDTTQLTGGILGPDTVGIGPNTGFVNLNYNFTDSLYLPDGSGENYNTTIDIFGYADDPIITEAADFVNICVNMEHSYLGDLEAWLTCPDGSTALLFDTYGGVGGYGSNGVSGGNTYLGDANDDGSLVPGIGFDYCFSDDGPLGTITEERLAGNTVPVNSFPPYSGNAMVAGSYTPEEPFSNFIGCPINGPWTLTIRDNIGIDNGYIFNWSIEFAPQFVIDSIFYTPSIADAYWLENPDIVINNDTIVTVVPSQPGYNEFTFRAEDSFGCIHDTTFVVYVRPFVKINDAIACDLTHTLTPINAPNGGVYTILERPFEDSDLIFDFTEPPLLTADITATHYGIYKILITEANCGYTDEAILDFRPDPVIEPLISDTVLCIGASIVLDAGPQEPNSDNFNINWVSSNTGTFNTEDYAVTIDKTGTYHLIITGYCGVATDTTDVVAITLDFDGKTACGLQSQAKAVIAPSGKGKWTGPENISFTSANQLYTEVSSSQYGTYDVTYTDDRCIEDGLTRAFIFVEQPEAIILPENPDFCVDLDPLLVTATVSGSFNGTYRWKINGEQQVTLSDSLLFSKLYFEALENYLFEVTVQDDYNVCPLVTGEMRFIGKWCEYEIPNVVTPNGDGKNDTFYVENGEKFPGAHLRVFDRWGLKVFDQANYDKFQKPNPPRGWDPVEMNSGTYFYELLLPSVDKIESGYIQILKDEP